MRPNMKHTKITRTVKILMGIALISYLCLAIAGPLLHNHNSARPSLNTFCDTPGNTCPHSDHDTGTNHNTGHRCCPICHFDVVASGAVSAQIVLLVVALLCSFAITFAQTHFYLPQSVSCVYLRAPPALQA